MFFPVRERHHAVSQQPVIYSEGPDEAAQVGSAPDSRRRFSRDAYEGRPPPQELRGRAGVIFGAGKRHRRTEPPVCSPHLPAVGPR